MSDFLTRLAERAFCNAQMVQPFVRPMFAKEEAFMDDHCRISDPDEDAADLEENLEYKPYPESMRSPLGIDPQNLSTMPHDSEQYLKPMPSGRIYKKQSPMDNHSINGPNEPVPQSDANPSIPEKKGNRVFLFPSDETGKSSGLSTERHIRNFSFPKNGNKKTPKKIKSLGNEISPDKGVSKQPDVLIQEPENISRESSKNNPGISKFTNDMLQKNQIVRIGDNQNHSLGPPRYKKVIRPEITLHREKKEPVQKVSNPMKSTSSPSPPTIRVTIGRIEVKAVMPPASASRRIRSPKPRLPVPLADYLKQQSGGQER